MSVPIYLLCYVWGCRFNQIVHGLHIAVIHTALELMCWSLCPVCSSDGIVTVVTTPPAVTLPRVDPEYTTLLDRSCRPTQTDESRALFVFSVNSCGTRIMVGLSTKTKPSIDKSTTTKGLLRSLSLHLGVISRRPHDTVIPIFEREDGRTMLCVVLWTDGRVLCGVWKRDPLREATPCRRRGTHLQGIQIQVGVGMNSLLCCPVNCSVVPIETVCLQLSSHQIGLQCMQENVLHKKEYMHKVGLAWSEYSQT